MRTLILTGLMLVLLSPIVLAKNVVATDMGKARKNTETNKISCPGTMPTCFTLYDDHTADIWINGDLHPGTWNVVYPPPPLPQDPVPMSEIPAMLEGTGYTADVECPTCPDPDPEE
jgi:hypothetical protein